MVGGALFEKGRVDVAFEVVDAHDRRAVHPGQRLGRRAADEERADEPGPLGHRDAVEIAQPHPGLRERPANDGHDHLEVAARGELGHDAAVGGVDIVLGGDDAREHLAPAVEHGGGGLVARRLDAEHDHVVFVSSPALLMNAPSSTQPSPRGRAAQLELRPSPPPGAREPKRLPLPLRGRGPG